MTLMKAFLLIFFVFFLVSCERTLPGSKLKIAFGSVIQKNIIPAHWITVDDSYTITIGDMNVYIPSEHKELVPDTFQLTISYRNEQDEKQQVTFNVRQEIYQSFKLQEEVKINVDGTIRKISEILIEEH